ncbi:MAG TPA: class I SAM-dependent methyltransferase [Steroidobacteraceae bacterium]
MNRSATALLGDTPERDYSAKLRLFNAFAEPELRQAIRSLGLQSGMSVLDAGCGTGEALLWLREAVGDEGDVVGVDLSQRHVACARDRAQNAARVLEGDLLSYECAPGSLNLIWSVNTLNHLHDPVEALLKLRSLVQPGGVIALGQSSVLPDMVFAWDAGLERLATEGIRQYYRERYGLEEQSLAAVRGLVGWLQRAGLRSVSVRTFPIERVLPLNRADRDYLLEAILRLWETRLEPYLSPGDASRLKRLCDPADPQFALGRPDFHFLQTFTLAVGTA